MSLVIHVSPFDPWPEDVVFRCGDTDYPAALVREHPCGCREYRPGQLIERGGGDGGTHHYHPHVIVPSPTPMGCPTHGTRQAIAKLNAGITITEVS